MGPSRLLLGFVVALVVCLIQIRASVESEEKMFPVAESEVVTDEEVNREIMKFHGTRQKRWVATAIGAGITLLGGLFSRNQAKQMARMYEKQMKFKLHELCVAICAEEWSMWTRCTQNCGVGGTRERTRKHSIIGKCKELSNFQCPHSKLQKQACNEGCPHGGTPNGTICACAPGWMSDCCTTEVRCKFPGKPSNGKVHGNWPAKFGHVVTYTCDEGYYLDGAESMECVGQGDWTKGGKVPTCKEIMCDPPSANPHLTILNPSSQGYLYGEEVVFRCAEGYVLRGPDKRVCIKHRKEKGRLTGFTPTCAAVSCGYPGLPLHGEIHGTKFNYKSTVNFTCATGFKLLGSQSLVCMANGKWLGMVPKCVQIECEPPFVPKNAEARIRQKSTLGTIVTFTCKDGYVMEGQRSLKCQADGQWNGTEPICKAADCGDPGRPENGARDGSVYHYPYNVTYSCFTGYKLKGLPTIHCQKSGKWSSKAPSCEACPLNHYMDALDKPGICQPCPDHTYTVTNGSRGRQQCMCKKGYKGPPGGPCIEIKCDLLYAPDDGVMDTCSNKVGSSCVFGCKDGFIIDRGSSQRTCQEDGNWDGTEPHCSPCPLHTYKSSEGSCMPCPPYSKTNSTGNMIKGCRCIKGYKGPPGGKCVDINECLENNGRGDCEDLCENRPGSFICGCSIPGYKLDDDKRHCIVEKECKNLTKAVLPENGGVVCHHYYEENSKQCKILCNKGYDFPSRVNDYEYCGPTTAYKWTFQSEDETAVMDPCIPELYPGYQQLSETDYFVRACDELTDVEKKAVFEEFKKVLDKNQICKTRATKVCNVKDMWIQCGNKTQVRRKRGVMETVSPVNLGFTIESQKMGTRREDCPRICQTLRIPSRFCDRLCEPAYKRFLQASVVVARRQLRDLYQRKKNAAKFKAAGRDFDPSGGINSGPVEMKCDPGQEGRWKTASCVPCNAGTYLDEKRKACVKCPVGTFQPLQGQSACVKCPTGSSNSKPGSLFCLICPPGKYGDMCNRTCECVHGSCDPRTGDCKCKSGWEGPRCDIDIPGCRDANCFRGVACTDIPAPATGFKCGPCPRGYFGDGATCTRRTEL